MWTALIFLWFFAICRPATAIICSVNRANEGFGDSVKCVNATVDEAMNRGSSIVAALTITHSRIPNIRERAFSKYGKSLQAINIHNCGLQTLHPSALSGLTFLKKLSLANNAISNVQSNWFTDLIALEQLDLSFNSIRTIDSTVFAKLGNLRTLNLDDNLLTCLETRDMLPLRSIAKIRILENPLSLMCRGRMTHWFNDKGINYSNELSGQSESWLDRVLWLCAEEEYSATINETTMRECVLLNFFNQLRSALKTTNSYRDSSQQCGMERQIFTDCIANSGIGSITNGEAIYKIITALKGAQEKLKIH